VAQTHELYCTAAGLALPPSAVITGRSAATLRGVALAPDSRGRLARVDLAFFAQRIAVEYDGGWREGELWALNRDRQRLNRRRRLAGRSYS
jgi:hypothetical protein